MDTAQLDINGSSGGITANPLAIPGLEGLQGMLGFIMIGSTVLGVLFLVLYILSLVQHARADRAVIAMHKDIAAIKEILQKQVSGSPVADIPTPAQVSSETPPVADADQLEGLSTDLT